MFKLFAANVAVLAGLAAASAQSTNPTCQRLRRNSPHSIEAMPIRHAPNKFIAPRTWSTASNSKLTEWWRSHVVWDVKVRIFLSSATRLLNADH